MNSTISKWGNSLALRLPKHVTDELRLAEGTSVEIEVVAGALQVTPTGKKLTLAELLDGEPPRAKNAEFDWGKPQGDEAW